jgi:acetate kinase
LKLDKDRNEAGVGSEMQITTDDSMLHAFVIPTDEELLIARDTVQCIEGNTVGSQPQRSSKLEELRT